MNVNSKETVMNILPLQVVQIKNKDDVNHHFHPFHICTFSIHNTNTLCLSFYISFTHIIDYFYFSNFPLLSTFPTPHFKNNINYIYIIYIYILSKTKTNIFKSLYSFSFYLCNDLSSIYK